MLFPVSVAWSGARLPYRPADQRYDLPSFVKRLAAAGQLSAWPHFMA